jgi:hypothetical protein
VEKLNDKAKPELFLQIFFDALGMKPSWLRDLSVFTIIKKLRFFQKCHA